MTDPHPYADSRQERYSDDGYVPVACVVADLIRGSGHVTPYASKTDLSGEYGWPEIFTSWAIKGTERVVLIEHRWPGDPVEPGQTANPDAYRCEHYVPDAPAV